ncbi:MAG TPA: type VI secretion system contractile sheath protein TssC, partial [Flavobacteriales bacterium]|nr:type VI secretion system contractile sheath protein TssC [Flavobacteriales bacterium]
VMELFQSANLSGGDVYKSNVVMGANWLIGRPKDAAFGEEDHLYVPPAGALAGKIYNTLMSQVTAGKKHGSLNEVDAVAFDLRKSEIAAMEKMGLVPMVNEYGKVMAFSAKTLFNGDNIGLQTYSVVRTFDYISKVLQDFLNRRAFENFNAKTQREIRAQIVKFLDGICGPGKLIEKFKILRFEQDPNQKDRIFLDIHMTPYFPAKNYVFKLDGQKGDDPDSAEWQTEYAQE